MESASNRTASATASLTRSSKISPLLRNSAPEQLLGGSRNVRVSQSALRSIALALEFPRHVLRHRGCDVANGSRFTEASVRHSESEGNQHQDFTAACDECSNRRLDTDNRPLLRRVWIVHLFESNKQPRGR
jgi:hypothetical protein